MAPGHGDLVGEPGSLGAHRVLDDLDEDVIALFQDLFDAGSAPAALGPVVADVAGVEHAVLLGSEVHEGGLHAGQDVLDSAHVHVADQRLLVRSADVVLDENRAFHHDDLRLMGQDPHEHLLAGGLGRENDLLFVPAPGRPLVLRLTRGGGLASPLVLGLGALFGLTAVRSFLFG